MKSLRGLLSASCAAALVAACAAPAPAPPPAPVAMPAPAPEPPPCNADGARFAIGQIASPQLENAARVRADAQVSRILKPNQVVTMEFDAHRLDLVVDGRNKVTAVRCG